MLPRVATPGPKNTLLAALVALSLANCVLITELDFSRIPKATGGNGGGGGSSALCSIDADCNDDLPCTIDNCETGLCTHTPEAEGKDCGSVTCVNSSTCDANGECIETPVAVDDNNGCTTDACDPQSGEISHSPVNVDDQIACTTDACDTMTGMVTHAPSGPGCLAWHPLPTNGAPDPREQHTAVWTGSKMIVWGGNGGPGKLVLNTGGVYDPAKQTWTPVSTNGAPSPRHSHQAVWTGTKMIVWGGYSDGAIATGGGMYDPETDSWTALTTSGEPTPRFRHSALWTGKTMIIYGGINAGNMVVAQGASFDPATNTWTNLPTMGQVSARFNHSIVWNGDLMYIWGGQDYVDWLATGKPYNTTTNAWMGPTPLATAPAPREQHTGVWTGSKMLIWGGWNGGLYFNTGAIFDPANNTWQATSTTNAPTPRVEHSGVWTGKTLVVWGGCGGVSCDVLFDDGGIFTPDDTGGSWQTIAAVAPMPMRRRHTTVWTGSNMIIWGGKNKSGLLNTGAETPL